MMARMTERYFEDFAVGQKFRSAARAVTAEEIRAFAKDFDPQPFHLDAAAAVDSLFGGLVASGWHTAALTMRLLVDSDLKPARGTIGAGVEELRWPKPVRPGDVLHLEGEVVDVRPSRSRPELGIVKVRANTINQDGDVVQIFSPVLMVRRKPVAEPVGAPLA
jgi:acyl dehydratase